ncbi:hypothetical protein ABT173_28865 [Streptomyces sp. NPDC001795]|uniref:hypothetical protein n=1 Tax=Streptomyces sp. NPDC001795 TaxID=3154525 RepID=UPI00331FCF62
MTSTAPSTPAALLPLVDTPEFDAELSRFLDSLDVAQLYAVETLCMQRQVAKYEAQLLTALRRRAREVVAEGETASRWPVVTLTFGTSVYDNGVFWDECTVEARHLDGTLSTVDLYYEDVCGVLADLSSALRPDGTDSIVVQLRTGEFDYQ